MMSKIGALMFVFGVCAGDSPCILAPLAMIGVGIALMWKGGVFSGKEIG